jgi:thioredoxin-like negative regulator of GroEL
MVFSWSFLLFFIVACSVSLISADQKEWTLADFKKNVIEDDRAWIVEFYSGMCGSCKEFAPTWDRIEMTLNDVLKTKVNIDQKGGMEVAQYMGALEEGLPNVRLGE